MWQERYVSRWFIQTAEITGGFLAGLKLRLPETLTCVIGPRGSGKSTLAEALRFCVLGPGGTSNPRLALLRANLGSSIVAIDAFRSADHVRLGVRRTYGQPATLTGSDGRNIVAVDLDRGTFLPLDSYSADRIEEIAKESVGDKRRILLDELRSDEFYDITSRLAEHKRGLQANADEIRGTLRLIKDLTERIEELGDARAKLASLPPLPGKDGVTGELARAAAQNQNNEREDQATGTLLQRCSGARQGLDQLWQQLEAARASSQAPRPSVNENLLRAISEIFDVATAEASAFINQASHRLATAEAELRLLQERLRSAHAAQRSTYLQLQQKNEAAGAAVRERVAIEQAVAAIDAAEHQRMEATTRLADLRSKRNTLKASYLLERDRISALREAVAAELQRESGDNVRVRIYRNADSSGYEQILAEGLKGARVRNHEEILSSLTRLRPEQFAQILVDNDLAELEAQTDLGTERCRKILESCRTAVDPLDLEILSIEDRVGIELNVATKYSPSFRDAAELSAGQKCTALLPLLMARRESPLIIDQPEDNLDNHFIYETVVESIRRLKKHRQMIFITHNANIPVLAEAEMIVVLNSDGQTGSIQKCGTLDDCKNEIIDLLEGGKEAFELRRRRYAK